MCGRCAAPAPNLTSDTSHETPIKKERAAGFRFDLICVEPLSVLFSRSSSTTQTGEVLSVITLHHRHHAVVLSIPSTTPPYLAGPGRWSRWCAARVHLSEASPLAALDQIGSRG
jgi:hypothetical protein